MIKHAVLVLMLGVGAAHAQAPANAFTSENIDVEAALVQAGLALFPQPPGTYLQMTRLHEHYKVHDQASFEKWEARTTSGQTVGELVRFRSFAPEGTVVDLALRVDGGKVQAAHALQPTLLRGKPFLAMPEFLVALKGYKLSEVAGGLSALFGGLAFLEAAIDQPPMQGLTDDKTKILVAWARKNRPPPARGSAFPKLDVVDVTGKKFDPRVLAGKPTVVLAGVLAMERDRRAFDWLGEYMKQNAGRFNLIELVQSPAEDIEAYKARGGSLPGIVLNDHQLKLHEKFKGAFTPTLYFYDAGGKLIGGMRPVAMTGYDKVAAQLDGLR